MFRLATTRHRLLVPLFFNKLPAFSSISAAAAAAVANFPQSDTVSQIIAHFNSPPLRYSNKFLLSSLRNDIWFKNEVPKLGTSEIETIIEKLYPENAIGFFFLLQNELRVKHSRISQFIIAHLLAEKKRPRALLCHLQLMLQDEGISHGACNYCFNGNMFCSLIISCELTLKGLTNALKFQNIELCIKSEYNCSFSCHFWSLVAILGKVWLWLIGDFVLILMEVYSFCFSLNDCLFVFTSSSLENKSVMNRLQQMN